MRLTLIKPEKMVRQRVRNNIISEMWGLYLKYEELDVDSWSSIEEMLAVWYLNYKKVGEISYAL